MSHDTKAPQSSKNQPNNNTLGSAPAALEPIIECPAILGPVARQEWDRIVSALAKTGVLTEFDRVPLAIFCADLAQWLDATENIQKYGTMIKSPSGYPVQSPYVAVANRAAERLLRIADQFGFTPASRGRVWMVNSNRSSSLARDELEPLCTVDLEPL